LPVVPPAIQIAAALVLSDEGRQGVEDFRHGAGRLPQPRGMCKSPSLPLRPTRVDGVALGPPAVKKARIWLNTPVQSAARRMNLTRTNSAIACLIWQGTLKRNILKGQLS
jgi:hypothetical protein